MRPPCDRPQTHWRALGEGTSNSPRNLVVSWSYPGRAELWIRGCGGGAAAVVLAPGTEEYCGVDISAASLKECERQIALHGLKNFRPLLIDASDPESAVRQLGRGTCDLFFSAYVLELVPTPEYGLRLLKIASELSTTGGLAIIQIKYDDGDLITASRRWSYGRNLAWNATYRIADFWRAAQTCDLVPKAISLVPDDPITDDRNYAWFALLKP